MNNPQDHYLNIQLHLKDGKYYQDALPMVVAVFIRV